MQTLVIVKKKLLSFSFQISNNFNHKIYNFPATVDKIDTVPIVQATAPAIGGLSHEDTAILAGILTGLATFLFLALPILCCLCPLPCCPCCGGGAAGSKHKKTAGAIGAAKMREMETVR